MCDCIPGVDKFPKLDHKNKNIIFLSSTATDNIIYFEDYNKDKLFISTHVFFGEVYISVLDTYVPLGAQAPQRSRYDYVNDQSSPQPLLVKIFSKTQQNHPTLHLILCDHTYIVLILTQS